MPPLLSLSLVVDSRLVRFEPPDHRLYNALSAFSSGWEMLATARKRERAESTSRKEFMWKDTVSGSERIVGRRFGTADFHIIAAAFCARSSFRRRLSSFRRARSSSLVAAATLSRSVDEAESEESARSLPAPRTKEFVVVGWWDDVVVAR